MYRIDCTTCKSDGPSSSPDPGREGTATLVSERIAGKKAVYWGESSRSALVRGRQHLEALKKPSDHMENALARHKKLYHAAGETPNFKMTLVGSFPKPLERQVWEGVLIRRGESGDADILMNSKLDHYAPAVGRMVMSRSVDC